MNRLVTALEDRSGERWLSTGWGRLSVSEVGHVITVWPPAASRRAARVGSVHAIRLSHELPVDLVTFTLVGSGAAAAVGARWPIAVLAGLLLAGWLTLVARADRELGALRRGLLDDYEVGVWVHDAKFHGWSDPRDTALQTPTAWLLDLAMRFEAAPDPVSREAIRWQMYELVPELRARRSSESGAPDA